jgi:hypothetical protein
VGETNAGGVAVVVAALRNSCIQNPLRRAACELAALTREAAHRISGQLASEFRKPSERPPACTVQVSADSLYEGRECTCSTYCGKRRSWL